MSIIKQLPKEVFEKIKAGEVVEDPASIVRELLDNCIDAGATKILVEAEEGGISKLVVSDNGKGMDYEDLKICYLPHTTSKIEAFEDIFKLQTVGFRGEALASISRVALVKITSSDNQEGMGRSVFVEGGQLIKEGAEAHAQGTSIEVRNLFYNVPVRKNFLKSPVTENRKIKEEMLVRALCFPEIDFTLKINGGVVLHFSSQEWDERIKSIFKEEREHLRPFVSRSEEVTVKGVISDVNTTFKTSGNLYFFVNNRYLKPRFLYGVVNSVCSGLIPRGRYPGGVIYIYTNPRHIDPNVHPSKKEVKIFVEDQIYRQVYRALKEVYYGKQGGSESGNAIDGKEGMVHPVRRNFVKSSPSLQSVIKKEQQYTLDFNHQASQTEIAQERAGKGASVPEYRYLGAAFGTYLVAEMEGKLLFVDFHAAHERKRYEELKGKTLQLEQQPLLHPRILNYKAAELEQILEKKELLADAGFDFYSFGEDSLVVKGVPAFYQGKDWEEDFQNLLAQLEREAIGASEVKDELLKRAACRGSYMSGERLAEGEAKELLNLVLGRSFPWSCPHGRPFVYELPEKELASKFLRGSKG